MSKSFWWFSSLVATFLFCRVFWCGDVWECENKCIYKFILIALLGGQCICAVLDYRLSGFSSVAQSLALTFVECFGVASVL